MCSYFEYHCSLLEQLFQEFSCVTNAFLGYLFWRTSCEDCSAFSSAFRSHIDNMVSQFDDIEVVFDNDHCVATIHEFL